MPFTKNITLYWDIFAFTVINLGCSHSHQERRNRIRNTESNTRVKRECFPILTATYGVALFGNAMDGMNGVEVYVVPLPSHNTTCGLGVRG